MTLQPTCTTSPSSKPPLSANASRAARSRARWAATVATGGSRERTSTRAARAAIGVVPQELNLDPFFTPREALELAGDTTVAVIGGAEIYAQFLPIADWIELTEVHRDYAGDTAIPPFGPEWQDVSRKSFPADENGRPAYSFVTLKRRL